jgi:hypothetical protein
VSEGGTELDIEAWLEAKAREFSDKIGALLAACFPGTPDMRVTPLGKRVRIRPDGQLLATDDPTGDQSERGGVPLHVRGVLLAWLRINYSCRPDSTLEHLAIDSSKLWVVSTKDRSPLFRFEYVYDSRSAPHSHIQVHAERGTLSHLLARTGHNRPHEMSALHLPTGGARFRPDLEDVIQFLIVECGFDNLPDWKAAVDERRAEWRAIQTRAAARALPAEAAEALRKIGYTVTPPSEGDPDPGRNARFAW